MNPLRLSLFTSVLLAACGGSGQLPCHSGDCRDVDSCVFRSGGCSVDAGAASSDSPCGDVPLEGRCLNAQTASRCIVPSGNASPRVSQMSCAAGEACSGGTDGAQCRLVGECRNGDTRCNGGHQVCANGHWAVSTCSGTCKPTASGAVCQTLATKKVKMKFSYEAKEPAADFSDWKATPSRWVAAGFLVISSSDGDVVDVTTTDDKGFFEIEVPVTPKANDVLTLSTVGMDGAKVGVMVANPRLMQAGTYQPGARAANAAAYAWSIPWTLVKDGGEVFVGVDNNSAAAWVFADALATYKRRKADFGAAPLPLVIWLSRDVTWTCGACQWIESTTVSGVPFKVQIALNGGENEAYWSDAVTGHELGHWTMSSFSTPPNEGGRHTFGVPTLPGQAWSEGWATYHQAAFLGRAQYFDKQKGSMFWFDFEGRVHGNGLGWNFPQASSGMLQRIDENEVAAMLWQMHKSSDTAPKALMTSVGSARMRKSIFPRGYTTHRWDADENGVISNIVDTHVSAPHFADYLDSLNCSGFPRSAIDAATQPTVHYPYPSSSPLCQ